MSVGLVGHPYFASIVKPAHNQTEHATVRLADGRIVIAWTADFAFGSDAATHIEARILTENGGTIASLVLNSTGAAAQTSVELASFSDGRFVATWVSYDNGDSSGSCIRARLFEADGTPIGPDIIVNHPATAFGDQLNPHVIALDNGHFWISFESAGGYIDGRLFNAEGLPLEPYEELVYAPGYDHAVAALSQTANFEPFGVAVWVEPNGTDGSGSTIRGRVITDQSYGGYGSAPGSFVFTVNTTIAGDQRNPTVTALPDGGFFAAWDTIEDPSGLAISAIRGRFFDRSGIPHGPDFVVSAFELANGIGVEDATVERLADGRFAVTWYETNSPYPVMRTTLLDALGYELDISSSPSAGSYAQQDMSVLALDDGRYMVTWQESDASGYVSIKSQIFDANTYVYGSDNDTRSGTAANEVFFGGGGQDTFNGLGGDDIINGDTGNDVLDGGFGNDKLFGGAGADTLLGGDGSDYLNGGSGADTMSGGDGDDIYLVDSTGDVVIEVANQGIDVVRTALDNYVIPLNVEGLELQGNVPLTAYGRETTDYLYGNEHDNRLFGNGGNDLLDGGVGNDYLDGGSGDDYMRGGIGRDIYIVDSAGDVVVEQIGGGEVDIVRTDIDNYTIPLNVEGVELQGAGNLRLYGNAAKNYLYGNAGANSLFGGDGNDLLDGGAGNDGYLGGAGDDLLRDTAGGDDTFVFSQGFGRDTIQGFQAGTAIGDVIMFDMATFANLGAVVAAWADDGAGNVVINAGNGNTVTILGVTTAQMSGNDFAFF